MLIKKIATMTILVLVFGIHICIANTVDITKTFILTEDTNGNDPIKLRQAFAQILVKNTGENLTDILQNSIFKQTNIKNGIKRSYFEKIETKYLSDNSPYHYWFHIVVQEDFLKQMIAEAGFSLLPANRNEVMIWMVEENDLESGVISSLEKPTSPLLSYVEDDEIINYWVHHWAMALGINVTFPRLDTDDKSAVTTESIKSLSFQALDQSVNKYAINQALLLYIKRSTDFLRIRSGYLSSDDDIIINHYQEPVVDMGSVFYSLMSDVANNNFQKTKIAASDLLKHKVHMVINNIENYDQIMQIQQYLSSLSVIESFSILSTSKGQLDLNVDLLIKTEVFLLMIEHDRVLTNEPDSSMNLLQFRVNSE